MSIANRFLRAEGNSTQQGRKLLVAKRWLKTSKGILFATVFGASVFFLQTKTVKAEEISSRQTEFTPEEERQLDAFLWKSSKQKQREVRAKASTTTSSSSGLNFLGPDSVIVPAFPDDPFPGDPTDLPTDFGDGSFPFPVFNRKNGASERIAMEVLYQTLMYYGVFHVVEKNGTRIDFKVIKSTNNYFSSLTKLDIAYAVREFGRYLTAHLCGEATMQNFYRAFAQVPAEEIGLRFKYDMAWALMGNSLPAQPNEIFKAGAKWTALQQILTTTSAAQPQPTEVGTAGRSEDFHKWIASIGDIMNVLQRLNKMMCYVDIRPDPKEELKKRVVVRKFLDMEKQLKERYDDLKQYLDEADKVGKESQLSSLRASPLDAGLLKN